MRTMWREWSPLVCFVFVSALVYTLAGCTPQNTFPTEWSVDQRFKVASEEFDAGIDALHADHKMQHPEVADEMQINMDAFRETAVLLVARMDAITDEAVANAESGLESLLLPFGGLAGISGLWAMMHGQRRKREDSEKSSDNKVGELRNTLLTLVHNMALNATPNPAGVAVPSPPGTKPAPA